MTTEDYLQHNQEIAPRFIGRRIASAVRLLAEPDDDDARLAWGPALVELDDRQRFVFDCEESLSNLIVRQMPEPPGPLWDWLASRTVRPPIATADPLDPLHVMLEQPIAAIDVISRDHDVEPGTQRYYEMCGWKVHFGSRDAICIGTHLTEVCFPSTAFYLPEEVDPDLRYSRLAAEHGTLISVGFFRELRHGHPAGPSLRAAVQARPQPDEARIAGYLRAGKPFIVTMGVTRDVLVDKGPIVGAPHVLTDGVYAWPADFAHYVERHHARVSDDFVAHMATNAWRVPDPIDVASLKL